MKLELEISRMKNIAISKINNIPRKGVARQKIISELKKRLDCDFSFGSGRIVGSMCTSPHPFAQSVFCLNTEKNLGDPGLFPGTAQIEKEVTGMLASLLSYSGAAGNIVSGGTEANILALWAARDSRNGRNSTVRQKDEVIIPDSAHFCFDKAANLLKLNLIKVKLNNQFQVDVKKVKNAITSKTLAIVGIAGTTDLGVVDPIPELSKIALAHNLHLHVDAAFGGFVLPFTNNSNIPPFDFRLPGVSSITIDPHKMGLAPIPSGVILFRNPMLLEKIQMPVKYLAGGESPQTLLGTRPGASAIAVWALLKHLGTDGYKKTVKNCMNLTHRFAQEIEKIPGLSLVTKPVLNIVGIKSSVVSITDLSTGLRRKGWAVAHFPNHIRIVLMPHIRSSHVSMIINDLKTIMGSLTNKGVL